MPNNYRRVFYPCCATCEHLGLTPDRYVQACSLDMQVLYVMFDGGSEETFIHVCDQWQPPAEAGQEEE
jgi:hypothetical protein